MGRLIDADALNPKFVHGRWDDRYVSEKEVQDAPTVDAVQVVRCKDCDNWDTEWKPIWGTERYCFTLDHITAGNFFCAYGERKKQPKTETKTDHWGYERLLCPNCKAQYTKGQRFCDNCGKKLI